MEWSSWEPYVAAAFAPAAVWLLWRGQTLSVELLRIQLVKLTRHLDQKWLYAIVSWFGVLLHELSHASVLLLSGHGIKEFRAGMETGHVTPAQMRKGVFSFLFFLVAALAPLFGPPLLVLGGILVLTTGRIVPWQVPDDALEPAARAVGDVLVQVPLRILEALANLDFANPYHLALFALVLIAMPASRPSHVKGSRFHKTADEGDVAVLRQRIRKDPWPFVAFLVVLYGAWFVLVPLAPKAYWYGFEAVWAVAATGIVLALFGAAFWSLPVLDGRASGVVAWLGPASFVIVQVAFRLVPGLAGLEWPFWAVNATAVGAWVVVALALAMALPRQRGLVA